MPTPYSLFPISQTSEETVRMDVTGILTAKLIEHIEGNPRAIEEMMSKLLDDPERVGSTVLGLVNLIYAYVSDNGRKPERFKALVDHYIGTLRKH